MNRSLNLTCTKKDNIFKEISRASFRGRFQQGKFSISKKIKIKIDALILYMKMGKDT